MSKITIVQEFEGFPDDTPASRRNFAVGETLEGGKDIPDAYADLLVAKGHAVKDEPETIAKDAPPAAVEKKR